MREGSRGGGADDTYAWFPFIRMRELFTGLLRDPTRDLRTGATVGFTSGLLPCFTVFGASQGNSNQLAWYIELKYTSNPPQGGIAHKTYGFGVRCVQQNK